MNALVIKTHLSDVQLLCVGCNRLLTDDEIEVSMDECLEWALCESCLTPLSGY